MPFPPLFLGSFPFLKPGEKKPSSLNEGQAKVMLGRENQPYSNPSSNNHRITRSRKRSSL